MTVTDSPELAAYQADLSRRAAELARAHGYSAIVSDALRMLGLPQPERTRDCFLTASVTVSAEVTNDELINAITSQFDGLVLPHGRVVSLVVGG